ncbi:hypothetical protein [Streptomyces tubercidicus]|uniref:hypothetical protein n=1 Tax=Streptomyces tubercidicus TaxID=47759 RepID=UPI0036B5B3C1
MTDAFMGIDQAFGGFSIVIWVPDWHKAEFDLKTYPSKTYGQGVDRLKSVSDNIVGFAYGIYARNLEIKHICMEGYARNSKFRREEAGELGATVKLTLSAAYSKPVSYPTIVPPKLLKMFVTGSGNSSKDDMRAGVHKRWGETIFNHNHADAYGLARMAEALHTGTADSRYPHEQIAIAKLTPHGEEFPPLEITA